MVPILFGSLLLLTAGLLTAKRHHRHLGWRRLIGKLDATPAQERALRDLLYGTRDRLRELRRDARGLRGEIGEAVRGDTFDEGRFAGAEVKLGEKLREAGAIVKDTLAQMHDVLDARQRAKVADWLSAGPQHCRFSHC